MSYDISLTADLGGSEPLRLGDGWNYTSNMAPAWRAAGADLAGFDGKEAGECITILRGAILSMEGDPDYYRTFDSPNGWGTYDTLLPALRDLLTMFESAPKATVGVWH